MSQGNEDFLLSETLLGHVLPHDGVATGVLMFVTQALKNALGRVPLLLENVPVILQDLMNDANEGTKFG
jgi:hypothetical protein